MWALQDLSTAAAALDLAILVTGILTACDSQPADASGMVVAEGGSGGPTVVVPVCDGESLIGATYWLGEHYSTVDLRGVTPTAASEDMTVELDMSVDALASGALATNAVAGTSDPALEDLTFYEMETVGIETTMHMIRIAPQTLDPDETAIVRWDYPFGRNDPVVTPADEEVGREELLDGCDARG